MTPKTLTQAKASADVGYQVTGGKFVVIPDPDCKGYFMSIPAAQHDAEVDPPIVYATKGKVY